MSYDNDKHVPSKMFLKEMDRTYTDTYMSDKKLAADPRATRIHQIEVELVRRHVQELPAGALVVDVPCGAGRLSVLAHERGDLQVVALDYNTAMLETMRAHGPAGLAERCARADALALPLATNSVDLLVNIRLLHHIPDRETQVRMLRQMARVARGPVLTSFWNSHCWRHVKKRLRGKAVKLYPVSPAHFRSVCAEAGLAVERLAHVRRWRERQTLAVCRSR